MPDVFTIDVEDWFHIMEVTGTPELASWDALPSRIEANLRALLELLGECNVKATCFVLGWVARTVSSSCCVRPRNSVTILPVTATVIKSYTVSPPHNFERISDPRKLPSKMPPVTA